MGDDSCSKPRKGEKHVLIVPVSLQAHISGILRLSIALAKRGVSITFVGLEKEIAILNTFEEIQALDFCLLSYKNSEEESELFTFLEVARNLFQPIFDNLVENKKAGLPGPTCIIGDRFLTWVSDIAKELNVPYYQFWSCGAIFVRELQAYPQLFDEGILTVKEESTGKRMLAEFDGLLKIPGLPALKYGEVTNSNIGIDRYRAIGNAVGTADAVIVNTFYELETPIIEAIRQSWLTDSEGKIHKLFPVGPISTAATFKDRSFVEDLDNQRPDCLKWLDSRPLQSVVYVCLGSLVELDSQQINELGLGLEAAGQSFLWVIRRGGERALPPGFRVRTRAKGMIVSGWVPQLLVLGHSSIGGFVTHCGWNSIIESITSGVPMAAWPQFKNDQFFNCRYLVDVLKVAVEVRPQDVNAVQTRGGLRTGVRRYCTPAEHVTREEFERVVGVLMSEEGQAMRASVQVLKKKAEAAVGDGGTSRAALNDLVESIPATERAI